jgi:hypothetical protein
MVSRMQPFHPAGNRVIFCDPSLSGGGFTRADTGQTDLGFEFSADARGALP